MFNSIFKNISYIALLIRVGGLKIFFKHLKNVFYYSNVLIGFEKIINTGEVEGLPSKIPFYLQRASPEDIREILRKIPQESGESAYELIQRIRFFESGFQGCCVGKITGTDDICYMQWLILPQDPITNSSNFKIAFPQLKENEFILENAYTFEKYRGNGFLPASFAKMVKLTDIAGMPVPKRAITYVSKDNLVTLKIAQKIGYTKFEERLDRKILFFNRRAVYSSASSPSVTAPA